MHRIAIAFPALLALLVAPYVKAGGEPQDIPQKALASVRSIGSYECDTTLTYSSGKVTSVKTACRENRYFFGYADIVPPQKLDSLPKSPGYDPLTPFSYKSAFNGANYQFRIGDSGITRDQPRKPFLMQPLMTPFLWLVFDGDNEARLETLHNSVTWEKRFERATVVGHSQIREEPCVVLAFPQLSGQRNTIFHVHFAENLGAFPLRYDRIASDTHAVATRCDVTKLHTFQVNGKDAYYPLQVKYEETGLANDHSWAQEMTIDVVPGSLRVNEQIDESVFTLPLQLPN